ncbi:ADP-ribosylation factor-related protein 1 [Grifola frondosa]|uniref:ADP-ribosylation factor-related protein 1 n=1 Tax=Grifola frondosa TaxID=5627 RepID=A0A1C7M2V0_GRIFR|nr:ADP-ribosylation factor-related protein 1 [Grifola frondosa]
MYHLLKGFHEYLTRKEEFSVIIIGLDGAGKTTLLEKIKTLYNDTPGLAPDKIAPTGPEHGKDHATLHYIAILGLGRAARHPEGWEVFDSVLSAPQILGVPLLLLANKQDSP